MSDKSEKGLEPAALNWRKFMSKYTGRVSYRLYPFLLMLMVVLISSSQPQAGPEAEKIRLAAVGYLTGINSEYHVEKGCKLLEQAADAGDPLAKMWLARFYLKGRNGFPRDAVKAQSIAATVINIVMAMAENGPSQAEAQFLVADAYRSGLALEKDLENALKFYTRSLEQHYLVAYEHMGMILYEGVFGESDLAKSVEYLSLAASAGDVYAAYQMGLILGEQEDYEGAAAFFNQSAEKGHPAAMAILGVMYDEGEGVQQDYQSAFIWYQKAAEHGHAGAMYNLGSMYYNGEGVTQDFTTAIQWFEKAAELGHPDAAHISGIQYFYGKGVIQDYAAAFQWFEKAATLDHVNAMYDVGMSYYFGRGIVQNYHLAFQWLAIAANRDHMDAAFAVGAMYDKGEGVAQDYLQAFQWFEKAANLGHAVAAFNLGSMYTNGEGVSPDGALAFQWFEKAASLGHPAAMHNVGVRYYHGKEVQQDYRVALTWFEKAASLGHVNAMHDAGWLYYHGVGGVRQDYTAALSWFQKAAAMGHGNAINQLGVMYDKGEGVIRDLGRAADLYRKAADLGSAHAMYNLGQMYYYGEGVALNQNWGLRLIKASADLGFAKAEDLFARLTNPAMPKSDQRIDGGDITRVIGLLAMPILLSINNDPGPTNKATTTCSRCDGEGKVECWNDHENDRCTDPTCEFEADNTFIISEGWWGTYYKRCDRCYGSGKE